MPEVDFAEAARRLGMREGLGVVRMGDRVFYIDSPYTHQLLMLAVLEKMEWSLEHRTYMNRGKTGWYIPQISIGPCLFNDLPTAVVGEFLKGESDGH